MLIYDDFDVRLVPNLLWVLYKLSTLTHLTLYDMNMMGTALK